MEGWGGGGWERVGGRGGGRIGDGIHSTLIMHTSDVSGCNHHVCKWSPPSGGVGSYPNVVGYVFPQVGQDVAGSVAR